MADLASSGDPDVDAVFAGSPAPAAQQSYQQTGDPDVDAVIRELGATKSKSVEAPKSEISNTSADEAEALGKGTIGGAEALLHGVTGRVMGAVGALGGHKFRDIEEKYTYEPRTAEGKALVGAGETASNIINRPGNWVTEKTGVPELGAATNMALQLPLLGGVARAAPEAGFGSTAQSMGAAATFPATAVRFKQPELQEAFSKIPPSQINPEVLARHHEADSLPIPMRLSPGQATGDAGIQSREWNNRGATGFDKDLEAQNSQLKANLGAIRDQVGPDVFSTNQVTHGDTLIDAYKKKDEAAQTDIKAKYQALKDANGGAFPVDAKALYDSAVSRLKNEMLYEHGSDLKELGQLKNLAEQGSMTFEQFEKMRTNLARTMRGTNPDLGNMRAAAGEIRSAMEDLPLSGGSENLKPLADQARAGARSHFQELRDDPAYKAAVNDTVSPDRFVSRFVVNAPRDDVATMRSNLEGNESATQTMGVAALDHLRDSAGIDPRGRGDFNQARFNRQLEALSPKMQHLFPPENAGQLETLGNVANYTIYQPRSGTFNRSNTLSGAIAQGVRKAAVGAANYAGKGIPLGDWGDAALSRRGVRKELERARAPLGGVQQKPAE